MGSYKIDRTALGKIFKKIKAECSKSSGETVIVTFKNKPYFSFGAKGLFWVYGDNFIRNITVFSGKKIDCKVGQLYYDTNSKAMHYWDGSTMQKLSYTDTTYKYIPYELVSYFRSIGSVGVTLSDDNKRAFVNAYRALGKAGLLNKIVCWYPMFGSSNACAYGIKGGKLTIPNGASYDKGLGLMGATGGKGKNGAGILLPIPDYASQFNADKSVTLVFGQPSPASSDKGPVFVSYNTTSDMDSGINNHMIGWTSGSFFNTHYSVSNANVPKGRDKLIIVSNASKNMSIYGDGTLRYQDVDYGSNDYNRYLTLGANLSSDWTPNYHFNMVMVLNKALTQSEVQALNSTIRTLQGKIY